MAAEWPSLNENFQSLKTGSQPHPLGHVLGMAVQSAFTIFILAGGSRATRCFLVQGREGRRVPSGCCEAWLPALSHSRWTQGAP